MMISSPTRYGVSATFHFGGGAENGVNLIFQGFPTDECLSRQAINRIKA